MKKRIGILLAVLLCVLLPLTAIAEGEGKYEINPDVCIECGACADTCPVGAPAQA